MWKTLLIVLSLLGSWILFAEDAKKGFGSISSGTVIPQVVVGDDRWTLEFVVVSLEDTAETFAVTFFDDNGDTMALPIVGMGDISTWVDTVEAHGVRRIITTNTGSLQQGYAKIVVLTEEFGDDAVAFYAVLTSSEPAGFRPPFRTFMPGVDSFEGEQRFGYDNRNANNTCIAFISRTSFSDIKVIARDERGLEIERKVFDLDDGQHTAFCLRETLPQTAGRFGVLDVVGFTGGSISFTFDSDGKFHTEMPYWTCCFDIE